MTSSEQNHPSPATGPPSQSIKSELADLLYRNALAANLSVIGAGLLVTAVFSQLIDIRLLLLWCLALITSAAFRLLLRQSYRRAAIQAPASRPKWLHRYTLATLAVGISWGGLGLLLLASDSQQVLYMVFMVLLAVIAMSVPVLSAWIPALLAYTLPQALFLIIGLLYAGDTTRQIMALGTFGFTLLTIITARNMNQHILNSLQLREMNQNLIDNLNEEIRQRITAQAELESHGEQLEELVATRTEQLRLTNRELEKEIGERRRAEENLKHLAHHDPLTNLPNRLLFDARLEHAIQQARRNRASLAVLFMDLDDFKHINDSLGHAAGDELLRQIGSSLRDNMRKNDTVARLGGDEFVILMEQPGNKQDVAKMAENIIRIVSSGHQIGGRELYIGTSIGISLFPDHGADGESLLMQADTAMYKAKNEGRGRFHFYTEALTISAYQRMSLESDLHRALSREELQVHYQPQYCFLKNDIIGVEALVRWQHPEYGLLTPDRFLRLAEETGLILPLGRLVLEQSCRQIAYWKSKGSQIERVAVNLSAQQIQDENLLTMIEVALTKSDCRAEWLELEITESFIMQKTELSIETLNNLRSLGVSLAIDDFGTGYSSLSYLKSLPVSKLKIDRSFVRDIATDANDAAIVSAVIAMGNNLNLEITAEGVESEEQETFLRQQGCNQAQGFRYGRAVTADKIEAMLAASEWKTVG